jgi:type VI secretion system secreted protein Hcp
VRPEADPEARKVLVLFPKEFPMIFLSYGGITEATGITEGHMGSAGWITLSSLHWGSERSLRDGSTGGNRQGDVTSVSEVVVTKTMDKSSYRVFEESTHGMGQKATIHLTKTDKDKQVTYMEYVLDDCLITGFTTHSSGDFPEETIAINFSKIQFNQTEMDAKNKAAAPVKTGWDLAGSKKF